MNMLNLILGFLLLAVPAGVLWLTDQQLFRRLLVSAGRMVVQLALMGLVLWGLYRIDRWWLSLLWLMLASTGSAYWVVRRTHLPLGGQLLPVSAGLFVGTFLTGFYLLWLVLPSSSLLSACWFVPVMGLLLGHSAQALVKGLGAFSQARRQDALQYDFQVGNGMPHFRALLPFVRVALQHVLSPAAANLASLAVFSLPLLLVGMLIGGFSPVAAAELLAVFVFACLAASVVSLVLALLLSNWKYKIS